MRENTVAGAVIGAAVEVHKRIGPDLLESVYATCLKRELDMRGIAYEAEFPVALSYKGMIATDAYRADFLVESVLIVELKAVEELTEVHKAQLLTYLKLTRRKLGLLINFNGIRLVDGVRRVVYNL